MDTRVRPLEALGGNIRERHGMSAALATLRLHLEVDNWEKIYNTKSILYNRSLDGPGNQDQRRAVPTASNFISFFLRWSTAVPSLRLSRLFCPFFLLQEQSSDLLPPSQQ